MTQQDAGGRIERVTAREEIPATLAALYPSAGPPVVVLVGGAGGMDDAQVDEATRLFRSYLVPAFQRWGATVVDGGTDAGIMRLIGQERRAAQADFGLVGVAAIGTVAHPLDGEPRGDTELEPHHPVVLLVPGTAWGDEAPWLSAVASAAAVGSASATLLINGGDIAYDDVGHSVAAGRPVVVVAGSGRTSDDLAAAVDSRESSERARQLVGSGLVTAAAADEPENVVDELRRALGC
ncbi:MAG: hypothetical protein ACJ71T_05810 [Actinomycetales bacterium]